MNWDPIERKLKRSLAQPIERWGNSPIMTWIAGKKDQFLAGRMQEGCVMPAKAVAEMQADEWSRALNQHKRERDAATRL